MTAPERVEQVRWRLSCAAYEHSTLWGVGCALLCGVLLPPAALWAAHTFCGPVTFEGRFGGALIPILVFAPWCGMVLGGLGAMGLGNTRADALLPLLGCAGYAAAGAVVLWFVGVLR